MASGASQDHGERLRAWEQQPDESDQAFACFEAWRLMPPLERTLLKVAQECSRPRSLIVRWKKRWSWSDREHAWDVEQDRLFGLEIRSQRRAALKKEWQIADGILALVAQGLASKNGNMEDVDLRSLAAAFKIAKDSKRTALSMPTEHLRVDEGPQSKQEASDVASIFTDPELSDALDDVAKLLEARGRGADGGNVAKRTGGAGRARHGGKVAKGAAPRAAVPRRRSSGQARRRPDHRVDASPPREE